MPCHGSDNRLMLKKIIEDSAKWFSWRIAVATLHDIVAAVLAWLIAYWLRFNFDIPAPYQAAMIRNLVLIIGLEAAIFLAFGLYRGIWRFASMPDLRRIGLAALTSALVVPSLLFMLDRLHDIPRSVLVLNPMLLVMLMGGSRFFYRAWKAGHLI